MTRQLKCECGDCRICNHRARQARYRALNREAYNAYHRSWYEQNAETHRETAKASRVRRIEAVRAYDRARGHRSYGVEKDKARRLAFRAIQSGVLTRQPCEVCGAEKVDAHHDDYGKPLDVRWLCRAHHGVVHRRVTF